MMKIIFLILLSFCSGYISTRLYFDDPGLFFQVLTVLVAALAGAAIASGLKNLQISDLKLELREQEAVLDCVTNELARKDQALREAKKWIPLRGEKGLFLSKKDRRVA